MTEYEKAVINRLDIFIDIFKVFLKFALDSSSYKSKTPNEVSATAPSENKVLNSLYEGTKQWSMKYFYMVALVL